jgi:hypothetical protein
MDPENANAFVRRHFEDFVNRQDLSAADRNFAADYRGHAGSSPRISDLQAQQRIRYGGIVIWRIVEGKLAERWAYLQAPQPAH